jgi:hypothetical protein
MSLKRMADFSTSIGTIVNSHLGTFVLKTTGWRIEVLNNGKYWIWRKGSRKQRISAYGGTFRTLDRARQESWQKNRKN